MLLAAAVTGCSDANRPPTPSVRLPAAQPARFVKLEQLSEWNGNAWASVAELDLIDATGAVIDRKGWTATADSADDSDPPASAIDGNPKTLWHSRWRENVVPLPHALVVDMGTSRKVSAFSYLPRQDGAVNGTIARYRLFVSLDGVQWGQPVAEGDFSGGGSALTEKTVVFAEQTANHAPVVEAPAAQRTAFGQTVSLRLAAHDADGDTFLYAADGLPPGLELSTATGIIAGTPIVPGVYRVSVRVDDRKAPGASVAFAWTIEPPTPLAMAPGSGEVRFVKLEQLSEVNGNPWASIAELSLVDAAGADLPRDGWRASADSAEEGESPGNAIDGDPSSLWHSRWRDAAPPPPHSFIIDLGHATKVRGFRYLPRQDRAKNGNIAKFRFYTSSNGIDWNGPVAEGDLSMSVPSGGARTVHLK